MWTLSTQSTAFLPVRVLTLPSRRVVRSAVWGTFAAFVGAFLLVDHPGKGRDFFQHFIPPENYAYPGWVASALSPLGGVAPEVGYGIFLLLSAAQLATVAYSSGIHWILVWPASLHALWVGNFTPWMFFGAMMGYRSWRLGTRFGNVAALLFFSLTLLKPHLSLGFLIWLGIDVWHLRRLKEAAVIGGGLVAFAALSLASGIPGQDYWHGWFLQNGFSPLSLLAVEIKLSLWGIGLALLGVWLARSPSTRHRFAAAWACGVLLTPYFQVQDLLLFTPALSILVSRDWRWLAVIAALAIAPWISGALIPVLTSISALGAIRLTAVRHQANRSRTDA